MSETEQHEPGTCLPRCPACIAIFGTELSVGDILSGRILYDDGGVIPLAQFKDDRSSPETSVSQPTPLD